MSGPLDPHAEEQALLAAFRAAAAADLEDLARLHHAEPDADLLARLRETGFPDHLGLRLEGSAGEDAARVMRGALALLPETPERRVLDDLAADYAAIYLNHNYQAAPSESPWLDEEHLERQEPMFRVREAYRRHGLVNPDWRTCPDDHLVLQCRFIAHLLRNGEGSDGLEEAARFVDDHLLRWLGRFSSRVAQHCGTPFYAGLALVTNAYCEHLRDLLAEVLDEPRPTPEEVERRNKPKPAVTETPVRFVPGVAPSW